MDTFQSRGRWAHAPSTSSSSSPHTSSYTKMLNSVRTARAQSLFSSSRKQPSIRFASGAKQSDSSGKMDPKQDPEPETRDSDISSMGEGYASRSEEEGFGGTCGRTQNQKFRKENDTEFDHIQECEVKEKEKAQNQKQ